MNVFKHLKEATYQIELLKVKLEKVTNPYQQQNLLKLINSFITLLNSCEALLNNSINTDVVDRLLLARIYSQLMGEALDEKVNIHSIVRNIDANLTDSKALLQHQITTFLQQKEIENIVNKLPSKKTDTFNVKLTASAEQKTHAAKQLKEITSIAQYDAMIEELLTELKNHIKWN